MVCVTLKHEKGCFDCTLRHLAAEITGLPDELIPRHWLYICRNPELAIAITMKNAIEIRKRLEGGAPVSREAPAWSLQYNSRRKEMLLILENEGYFTIN
jgi:hypothetical protein